MKVELAQDGAIVIYGRLDRISEAQLDQAQIMEQVSELLGDDLGAVKLGGYWILGRRSATSSWTPVFGGHEQPASRKLIIALATATQRPVRLAVQPTR